MAGGVTLLGLRDHHVHLGLVDRTALAASALSAVDDLGWTLDRALDWRRRPPGDLRVRVAGPFLTAPGGYPGGRSWAPDDAVVEIDTGETAARVVHGLAGRGVEMIKVVLHAGMPLLGEHGLAAVIATAHQHELPVIAHAEGAGQVARALTAGVDVLAHTPWDERLPDSLLGALAGRMTVISSLAIHTADQQAYAIAVDNLARFHAAGGRVRYGTDLGNGVRLPGLDPVELAGLVAAGLAVPAILATVATEDQTPGWRTWSPHPRPGSATEVVDWFDTVRRSRAADDPEGIR